MPPLQRSSRGGSRLADMGRCLDHKRVKAIVILFQDGKELGTHARLPEIVDVAGHTLYRLILGLGVKEGGDLVGHIDQLVGG